MKGQYINTWIFAIICILVGCSDFSEDDLMSDEVRLQAVLSSGVSVHTKGVGSLNSQYNGDLVVGIARVDQNADQTYPQFSTATEILKANMMPGEESVNIRDIEFDGSYQTFLNSTSGIKYASWYPYRTESGICALENGVVTIPIDGSTDVLYGSVATGKQTSGFNTIVFDHALSKFSFKVYAMIQKDEEGNVITHPDAIWGTLDDVRIISTAKECELTLPDSEDKYSFSYPETNNADVQVLSVKAVTGTESFMSSWDDCIGVSNAISIGEVITAPPQDNILKLRIYTDKNGEVSQDLTIARDFKAGKSYEVYLRFSDHGFINPEVSVGEWIEDETKHEVESGINTTYYDLSANQTANCYVVSSANYSYCFSVDVKGNSKEAISPDKVDIVWIDDNLKDYFNLEPTPIQGRAMFHVVGKDDGSHSLVNEGNVLIGAYEGDELVWCWHIWLTDRPQEQSYKNGFVAQDRDLGAVAPDGDGLYYQWGRPTPFALGRTVLDANGTAIEPDVSDDTGVDVDARTASPLKFYSNRIESDDKSHLWGWISDKDGYEKSMYDPCPVGYRVPSKRLWRDIVLSDLNFYENHSLNFKVDSYYDVYYPFSGYYDTSLSLIGYYSGSQEVTEATGAYMWAATYDESVENNDNTTGSPFALDYSLEADKTLGEMHVINTIPGTCALPVRCVSLHSEPHVHDLSAYQTANSYMITTGNRYYKFKASVKGNGVGTLVKAGDATSLELHQNEGVDLTGDLVKVDYLWWQGDLSTADGNASPADNLPLRFEDDGKPDEDGYVTFFVDELMKGNLVVAGYDVQDKIIWSWHFWFLDSEPEVKSSNDYAVMDRFLGATIAPATAPAEAEALGSLGLYYQWGRKDPFQGPVDMTVKNVGTTSGFSEIWVYDRSAGSWKPQSTLQTDATAANKSIVNSVANPMTYFCASDRNVYPWPDTDSDGDAGVIPTTGFSFGDAYNVLQNACFERYVDGGTCRPSLWGYSSATGYGTTTTKTMYDPCPPGYSVAYYMVWADVDTKGSYYSAAEGDDILINTGPGAEVSTYGIFLNDKNKLFDYTWYPFTGYIKHDGSGVLDVGTVGRFHSSTPGGNPGSRSLWYNGYYTGQAVSSYRGIPSSYAYPVRCQKD